MRFLRLLQRIVDHPIESIALVLAGGLVIYALMFGIVTFTGTYEISPGAVLDTKNIRYLFCLIYAACGIPFIYSYVRGKAKAGDKMLYVFIAYLSILLLRLMSVGFFPLVWFFILLCTIIAAFIYFWMLNHARS